MKAIVLPQYNKNIVRAMLSLKIEDVAMISPVKDSDVIVKVHAAPVNPSDIAFIQGGYNIVKTLPAIPGFEASGIVVDAGKEAARLIGKKVCCFVQTDTSGTWSEYVVANSEDVIVLKDNMDMDQAACMAVNPITAMGMFEIVKMRDAKAIMLNAAGGQVAGFIRAMAAEVGVDVINIVRKSASIKMLEIKGAKNVVSTDDANFEDKLRILCDEYKPTVAFDAVGGELSGIMFNALDNDSELVVYGGLSNKPIADVNVMDVIFKNKIISGFNLVDWKNDIDKEDFDKVVNVVQDKIIQGIYTTQISSVITLEDVVVGLKSYISDMSSGKLLIKP